MGKGYNRQENLGATDGPQLREFSISHPPPYIHTKTYTEPLPTEATRPVGAGGGAVVL